MFKNYFLTTLRSLRQDLGYAAINIGGLAMGVACFVILALFLESELTYDRHYENYENIYRVSVEIKNDTRDDRVAVTSRQMAPLLGQDFPEVKSFVRLSPAANSGRLLLRDGDTRFYWSNVYLADENVFEVFSHRILHGDPKTALKDPLSIAISEKVARQYFGDENPIGKKLSTDTAAYHVTLVYANPPDNTHLKYDALLSYNRLNAFLVNVDVSQALWGLSDYTYVVMQDGYDPADFEKISDAFYQKYMAQRGKELGASDAFFLEPLGDIHLGSDTQSDLPRGNLFYVYTFTAIALFVLMIACINYMNLATARSIKRSKEVAMRKILGASHGQLVTQFLGESLIFSVISVLIALLLVYVLLNYTAIGSLLGKSLTLDLVSRPLLIVPILVLAISVGLISGLYPAFYLAAVKPIAALRGSNKGDRKSGGLLRQVLVFLQFAISVGVIACTLLMALQMQYLRNKPLGYDPENIVIVTLIGADLMERVDFIKGDLTQNSNVLAAAMTPNIPGERIFTNLVQADMDNGKTSSHSVRVMGGDANYNEVMGLELVHGRWFAPSETDKVAYVNEALVKKMGWTEPLGKRLVAGDFDNRVVGVVRDFHFESLHTPVEPLYIFYSWVDFTGVSALNRAVATNFLYIKLADQDVPATFAFIEERFGQYDPTHPFEYRFLTDVLDKQYATERRQMELIGAFAAICILISCLGLFGLSAFTTAQRTKEIGIRKILGASTGSIIMLLFGDMVRLILAAAVVASVLAYYVISNWLAGFAYKEGINLVIFLVSGAFCVGIAFATVTLQSLKSARANPSTSLRYEG